MKREQAKKLAGILKAYANGADLQYMAHNEWVDMKDGDAIVFCVDRGREMRVKPETLAKEIVGGIGMVSNFELLMGFKNMRDFAICMSKNNVCCHKDSLVSYDCVDHNAEDNCRRCWLDFLTSDEGLDSSYLNKAEPVKRRKNLLEE